MEMTKDQRRKDKIGLGMCCVAGLPSTTAQKNLPKADPQPWTSQLAEQD